MPADEGSARAHPLGVPGSAPQARHNGASAPYGQHREVVKMAAASSFLAHMEVKSGFVVWQPPVHENLCTWHRGCVLSVLRNPASAALKNRSPP